MQYAHAGTRHLNQLSHVFMRDESTSTLNESYILKFIHKVRVRKKRKKVIFITRGGGGGSARVNYHFLFFVPNVLKIISRH